MNKHIIVANRIEDAEIEYRKAASPSAKCVWIAVIFEAAIKHLYRAYLGYLADPQPVLAKLQSYGGTIDNLQFGQTIGLIADTTLLEQVYYVIHQSEWKKKRPVIEAANAVKSTRNPVIHTQSQLTPSLDCGQADVELYHAVLTKFLSDFEIPISTSAQSMIQDSCLGVQYLNSEIQLYESLLGVLNSGKVDCVDATYFSHLPPNMEHDGRIRDYYQTLDRLTKDNKIVLRRVLSMDAHDTEGKKLLWLLFDLFPRICDTLGDATEVRLFQVANSVSDTKTSHHVNLVNLILMYAKGNVGAGHVWLFGSHPRRGRAHEYIHLHGNHDIDKFQHLYNDMFKAAQAFGRDTAREMLERRWSGVSLATLDSRLQGIQALFERYSLPAPDMDAVKSAYRLVFAPKHEDHHGW